MATRAAACHCGQLRLDVTGDRFVVSICNCLACQRRTGSAFGMQAAFNAEQVQVSGRYRDFSRMSDEEDRKEHAFHFCPDCGSQVFYTEPTEPDLVVVSVGSFADPTFPPPTESGYDEHRHHWVRLPDSVQRYAPELWDRRDPSTRPAAARRRRRRAAGSSSSTGTKRTSTTTWRAARASPAGRPKRSSTSGRRSACGRAAATWRRPTPTSTRSGTSRPSRA